MSSESSSLHHCFIQCVACYRALALRIVEAEKLLVANDATITHDRIIEESGRLKIWGDQTRASLPAGLRGSLDHFLRNETNLAGEVRVALNQLQFQLEFAVQMIDGSNTQELSSHDDSANNLVSDSDYSSESDAGEAEGKDRSRQKIPKLSVLLSHVFEQIQVLYHFGSLLRRPGLKGRYIRHDPSTEQAPGDLYDLLHVQEKLRQWKHLAEEEKNLSMREEAVVTQEELFRRLEEERLSDDLVPVLARRFARANTKRREQLRYWTEHPYRPIPAPTEQCVVQDPPPAVLSKTAKEMTDSLHDDGASAVKPASQELKSERSRPTVLTFSTVAQSAVFESATEIGQPRTIYAESVVAGKWSTRVPPPPPSSQNKIGKEVIECPYCYMELDTGLVQDRRAWKRHVFRDLRPYSCTFKDCTNPQKLYTTRHEWAYHEMQMHRRCWVCQQCNRSFNDQSLFAYHLRTMHPGSWRDHQLRVIIEMSERPIDELEITPCPLCKSELSLKALLDHLAGHMEEISLFVLPTCSEATDTDSNAVVAASSQGHKSTDTQSTKATAESPPVTSDKTLDGEATTVPPMLPEPIYEGKGWEDYVFTIPDPPPITDPTSGPSNTDRQSKGTGNLLKPALELEMDTIDMLIHQLSVSGFNQISEECLISLCTRAKEILLSQATLLKIKAPIYICGSVQGHRKTVRFLFRKIGEPPRTRYLFLGQYIDRSNPTPTAFLLLLAYMVKYPNDIFLLRGYNDRVNGDDRAVGRVWAAADECFDCLPLAAIIDGKIFAVHGGLSPDLTSFEQIRKVARPNEIPSSGLIKDLLTSYPENDLKGWSQVPDTTTFSFGADIVDAFLQKHEMDLICTAHQNSLHSYEFFFERRLVSLWSLPVDRWPGAVMKVDDRLVCSFRKFTANHVNSSVDFMFPCADPDCDLTFSRIVDRDRHIKTVHALLAYTCKSCSREFNSRDNLRTHHREAHGLN